MQKKNTTSQPFSGPANKRDESMAPTYGEVAEILLNAELSYGVRGQLNIDLRRSNESKGEKSKKLQILATSLTQLGDVDPRDIHPSSELLVVHNPGPSLRHIVTNVVTDPKMAGLAFDKSQGKPTFVAEAAVEAINDLKASAPPVSAGMSRF